MYTVKIKKTTNIQFPSRFFIFGWSERKYNVSEIRNSLNKCKKYYQEVRVFVDFENRRLL